MNKAPRFNDEMPPHWLIKYVKNKNNPMAQEVARSMVNLSHTKIMNLAKAYSLV